MNSIQSIQSLRLKIDEIDRQLALLLSNRVSHADQIWKIKKASDVEFIDLDREIQVIQQISNQLIRAGVDSNTHQHVVEIFKSVLEKNRELLALRIQK